MIVALDVSYMQRGSTGIGRYTSGLLRGLLNRGERPELILHGWSLRLSNAELESLAAPGVRTAVARIPGPIKRFYWTRLRVPPLSTLIGHFDIFHGAEPLLPPLGSARGIVTVHDMAYLRYPEFFERPVLRRDPHVRRALRDARAIIVPSRATMADLVEALGVEEGKITLVRPPVLPACSPAGDLRADDAVLAAHGIRAPFALFVGTLEPRKNLPSLIEGFARLHVRGGRDLDLVIAGQRGWMYEGVLEAIRRSPARARIRMLGFVTDDDLASLYRRALFFVYPSFYEGYGSPVGEAMASGLPVITSDNSALREIASGAALLVDPRDTLQIADAMDALLNDGKTRSALGAAGLARIRELNAGDTATALVQLYERVMRQ